MTASTTLDVPKELATRYENLASRTGHSVSRLMGEALEDSISRLEYEYGLLQQVDDYHKGRLKTYGLEEVNKLLGLED